ncbi:transporter substrate-binding domain-containing protein [Chitinimonas naiadis]
MSALLDRRAPWGFWLLALLVVTLFTTPMSSVAATTMLVRFAPEKDYGPFVYQDKAGRVRGLSVDMLGIIGRSAGMKIETLPACSLSEILPMAQRGEVDLVSSLRPTPERGEYLDFSRPYVTVPAVLLMRKDASSDSSLLTLAKQSVAVGKGYAVEGFLREKFPDVHWVAVADDLTAIKALLNGEVRGVVADIASINFVIGQHKFNGLQVIGPVGFEYALCFGFRKDRPDIGEALERGIRDLNTSERDKVIQQWMDVPSLQVVDATKDKLKRFAALLLFSAALLLLTLYLRHKRRPS